MIFYLIHYICTFLVDIDVPPTPVLVEDSLTPTTLTLRWENNHLKRYDSKLLYFVQWKYEDLEGDWQYCNHQNWNGNNQIFVHRLQSYTNYRFRLAILLQSEQQDDQPIFSQPSTSILTLSNGPPSSAPVILTALPIDHSRIYVNWKAGLFANGPLFSYVLRLKKEGHEAFQLKDIPISQDTLLLQTLESNVNYSVTLTMRNGDGEGPATSIFVKTLPEPNAILSEKPSLLLTREYSVVLCGVDPQQLQQGEGSMLPLYTSSEVIRDSAMLASKSLLFVSDDADRLWRISFDAGDISNGSATTSLLLEPETTRLRPWALNADWLNLQLFLAGQDEPSGYWEIVAWNLESEQLGPSLVTGITERPLQLEVDPVNGFLFWSNLDGINRVNLGLAEPKPEQILRKHNLGAFVVDFGNRRLLVPYQMENTIKSVSLDGKIVVDVRSNTEQPKFDNVTSMAIANGLFYWTDGSNLFAETYESTYFHNIISNRSTESLIKLHTVTNLESEQQPIPVPGGPPRDVECLALSDRARITWRSPDVLPGQSSAAFSNWSYALVVEDEINGELIQQRGLRAPLHQVTGLRPNSLYSVRLAACSSAGDGPWSADFRIHTLGKDINGSILWSTRNKILSSDLIGGNVKTLVNMADVDREDVLYPIDVNAHRESLFIVGNNSKLYTYNTTNHQRNEVKFAYPVSNVEVEWITEKIYWADPEKQVIFRSNQNGSRREPIILAGMVKNLLIDSMEAYLYWSTSRTVEVVRLNGEGRRWYRSEEDFNGQHVAGLTLDLENRFVYWAIGDYEGEYKMYRSLTADMLPADREIVPDLVSKIPKLVRNSLSYASERFLLLESSGKAVSQDGSGTYPSSIRDVVDSSSGEELLSLVASSFSELQQSSPSLTNRRNRGRPLQVSPEPVNSSSISVAGNWRDFNVTWQPSNNTNYGRMLYQLSFTDYFNVDAGPVLGARCCSMPYPNADRLLPYSLLEVTVKAYTYWDAAPQTSRVLRSPQTVPSQPIRPRAFVESYKDPMAEHTEYTITFRWDMPEFVNGPLLHFIVQCWLVLDGIEVPLCDSVNVPISQLEYRVNNLQSNTTYYFKVCAFSEVGSGAYTDTISTSTDLENPTPQLLVATFDDVKKLDLDQRTNLTITRHIAVEMAHLAVESKIYWINEMQELVTADVDGKKIIKILTLNNTALSLCADWISRNLFWTESNFEESGESHIMKLDLTVWEAGIFKFSRILSRSRRVVNLDIAPLAGTLFWIELSTSDLGYIIQSDLSGENVQPFFNHTEDCSCPFRPTVQPVFTVDNADPSSPVIYWVSAEGELQITDVEGCSCSLVLKDGTNRGLPPTSLTTDKTNIYWSDISTGKIHYMDKNKFTENSIIQEYPIDNVRNIEAIGRSLQPYPDSDCLMPQRAAYSLEQISRTATSITLRLPDPKAYLGCEKYNLPATLYTIDVFKCIKQESKRKLEARCAFEKATRYQTYWKEFEVKSLEPFTEYQFKLTLANFYGDKELSDVDQDGPGKVFRTGAGTPSQPQKVRVRPLTPELGTVEWEPPKIWNAEFLRYKVLWRSTKLVDGVISSGEKMVSDGQMTTHLRPLKPGQEYLVYVRAYPENVTDIYSESDESFLSMYPEPNNITLVAASSDALNISWVPMEDFILNYTMQFANKDTDDWQAVHPYMDQNGVVIYQVSGLLSDEYYKFRILLRYRDHTENFVWPLDDKFTFHTLEDIPTAPGAPVLENLQSSNHQLKWDPSKSLVSQNLLYFLEAKVVDSPLNSKNDRNSSTDWISYYNGSVNWWDIETNMHQKYLFRVKAKNAYGFSNWSEVSSVIDLTDTSRAMVIAQEHLGLILGLCIPTALILFLCLCFCLCPFQKKTKEDQKKIPIKMKPNVELATLREIPRGNFVESNALYVAAIEADMDDSLLPKIPREQISLSKFLGRGAFGEVFQGVIKDVEGPGSKTPIAIKTLRKGASAQEKNEFLQEAKLMSHFQHKHVLRLLGVCFDTETPLLLLELMAGGDLLSYLRISRSLKPSDPAALRLQDLLSMCEDVARGCRYLEELHFVHRDIACRNCLVSARERERRVVKIGDFGLARDIYKNDYYRKEGEGLLPVRWMAPESLIDGVFTSQSDVWAFGVLMWEITSLGQQPYQARDNLEVLHHVRAGGRLPKPLNCPPRLHQLMLSCWAAAETRPTFRICLEHIVALRASTEDATLSPVNPGQFLAQGNLYKTGHFNDNLSIQSLLQDSGNEKPALGSKLSWLLDDTLKSEESKDPRAEYEIPKSIPVDIENIVTNKNRYVEMCIGRKLSDKVLDDTLDTEGASESSNVILRDVCFEENSDCRRTSITSLNLPEKLFDRVNPTDKRSSTASLGDRSSFAGDAMKQSGSYAKLVGNGEPVSSLSDWRRVKKIATDERDRHSVERNNSEETRSNASSGASSSLSYSLVAFSQSGSHRYASTENSDITRAPLPKLQRSKSTLQNTRANIPLVINSGLLNMLRQASDIENDEDEIMYANVENETVTDL
ncbi:hypothetical protein QAD02_014468 [Eretmocerus hayati]|uniref:Uncharacterized protein n=1 Tax=Eretmocerus hayati TaxID=131215 RepID=A0ACC2P5E8_9HYME|nr:hypothetical protein QAD02_014468 [Eretmocerus hayati]